MADLDRNQLLSTLADLAAPDDDTAAEAARMTAAMVADAGLDWSDLIVDDAAIAAIVADRAQSEAATPADAGPPDKATSNEDARMLIDRLLERKNLYEGTRDELIAYKADIENGEFDKNDLAYLNALYARVMMGKSGSRA